MKAVRHRESGTSGLALRSLGVGGPVLRSLGAGGALLLAPKCALCLLGYVGLGAALGLTRPELCGAPTSSTSPWLWLSSLGLVLAWLALRRR